MDRPKLAVEPRAAQRSFVADAVPYIAVGAVLFYLFLDAYTQTHGRAAFPEWVWDLYDYKVWPLTRLR